MQRRTKNGHHANVWYYLILQQNASTKWNENAKNHMNLIWCTSAPAFTNTQTNLFAAILLRVCVRESIFFSLAHSLSQCCASFNSLTHTFHQKCGGSAFFSLFAPLRRLAGRYKSRSTYFCRYCCCATNEIKTWICVVFVSMMAKGNKQKVRSQSSVSGELYMPKNELLVHTKVSSCCRKFGRIQLQMVYNILTGLTVFLMYHLMLLLNHTT